MDHALSITDNTIPEDEEYENILRNLHHLEWDSSRKYDRERDQMLKNLQNELLLQKALNDKLRVEKDLEISQKEIDWRKKELKVLERDGETLQFMNRHVKPKLSFYMRDEIARLDKYHQDMQATHTERMKRMQKELDRVLNFIENTFSEEEKKMVHIFLENFEEIYNESLKDMSDDDYHDASDEMPIDDSANQTIEDANLVIADQSDEIQVEPSVKSKVKLTTMIEVAASQDDPMIEKDKLKEGLSNKKDVANESIVKKTRFDLNISYKDEPVFCDDYFDKEEPSLKKEEDRLVKTESTKTGIFGKISNAVTAAKLIFPKKSSPNSTKDIDSKPTKNKDNSKFAFKKPFATVSNSKVQPRELESFNFDLVSKSSTKPNKATTSLIPFDDSMSFNKEKPEEGNKFDIPKDFFASSPVNSPENKSDNFAFNFAASPEENPAEHGFQFNFNETHNHDANESFKLDFGQSNQYF